MKKNTPASSVDAYISEFPADVQKVLNEMRQLIKVIAPEALEEISYGMPAYKLNGPLVYFAGYKNHIGLYATPSGHSVFEKELSIYKQGKGSVQFPLKEPMPWDLIKRIVKFRLQENLNKSIKKGK
ncbi:MAG: DUF1801 domain-containing protein [Saprospiraceae bacterium]|nr:DUF1801 domain-containing protein [Saprospiraceae bacterium]